jgi:hypothetical protein
METRMILLELRETPILPGTRMGSLLGMQTGNYAGRNLGISGHCLGHLWKMTTGN